MKTLSLLVGTVACMVLATAAQAGLVTTGLDWHLDASDSGSLTLTGGNQVSQWNDTNPNVTQVNVSQATSANQPILVPNALNGLPVVQFNGTTDYLANATATPFAPTPQYTVFIVFKANMGAEQEVVDATNGVAAGLSRRLFYTDSTGINMFRGGGGGDIANNNYPAGTYVVYGATWDSGVTNGSSSDISYRGITGSNEVTGTMPSSNATFFPTDVAVGATADPLHFSFYSGGIGEILLYNTVLDPTDYAADMNYLEGKWLPEPASLSMLGMGGVVLLKRRRTA